VISDYIYYYTYILKLIFNIHITYLMKYKKMYIVPNPDKYILSVSNITYRVSAWLTYGQRSIAAGRQLNDYNGIQNWVYVKTSIRSPCLGLVVLTHLEAKIFITAQSKYKLLIARVHSNYYYYYYHSIPEAVSLFFVSTMCTYQQCIV